ncbi:hypothetical protein NIES4071_25320 [Calothrix sp. NIES-4071]|nr:hypothetical protein NIES4071_25320 [Calothrix sp. NIES-4071]BAZ56855.1 hypothetical protein NIES4105_25260 [Calothrix sp. NIES-4105]
MYYVYLKNQIFTLYKIKIFLIIEVMLKKVISLWLINVLLVTFLNACSIFGESQNQIVVPAVVEKGFNSKYSANTPRTWQRHYDGYEAIFTQNNIKYNAEFSSDGKWLETEYLVSKAEYPSIVLQKIQKKYPKFLITKYEIEITPRGLFYEVDITDGEIEDELYFDEKGNLAADLHED